MQNATDGKTASSSLLSSCMTSTTMAGKSFSFFLKLNTFLPTSVVPIYSVRSFCSYIPIQFYLISSLDKNDFECLAVRNTVIEGKGTWDEAKYKANSEIMAKLWNEIADLADFDKVRLCCDFACSCLKQSI